MMEFLSQAWFVLCGVLLLGILVAIHEFGHFMAARLTGIEVQEFAIGMGPKIVGWTGKRGTKFSLRWIPFGGFCAFYGEDDVEGKSKDDPRAYNKQAVWKRMLTVAMGPLMNFVLAIVVAVTFFWCTGVPTVYPYITEVDENSPAYADGLRGGCAVQAINGVDVSVMVEDINVKGPDEILVAFNEIIAAANPGDVLTLDVIYVAGPEGQLDTTTISTTVYWDEVLQMKRIGVGYSMCLLSDERTPVGFLGGIRHGWNMCVNSAEAVVKALGGLFTDAQVRDQISGPVGAVDQVRQTVEAGGLNGFLCALVAISVNLGLMNLLPIPGLDGSRLIFHAIEGVRGKPIKQEHEAMIHLTGMVILLGLMALLTLRDVWRLF